MILLVVFTSSLYFFHKNADDTIEMGYSLGKLSGKVQHHAINLCMGKPI